jgi:PAS domain S-box-containing protein
MKVMSFPIPIFNEPKSLYELSWAYAQDGKIAIDADAGTILDANPAMESLTGYSRAELIGMQVTMLYPKAERERGRVDAQKGSAEGIAPPWFSHPAQRWKFGAQSQSGRRSR